MLSLVCSGTVQVWWMMSAKSVADYSRHSFLVSLIIESADGADKLVLRVAFSLFSDWTV